MKAQKNLKFKLFYKQNQIYPDLYKILLETDKDFIPALSEKFDLNEVVSKFINFSHCYIAYYSAEPIGFVSFYPNPSPKDSYLSLICVRKKFRGMEIGKRLELMCIDHCKKIGSIGLYLNMRKSNNRLINSRLNLGYDIIREYKSEISDEVIVDLFMKF